MKCKTPLQGCTAVYVRSTYIYLPALRELRVLGALVLRRLLHHVRRGRILRLRSSYVPDRFMPALVSTKLSIKCPSNLLSNLHKMFMKTSVGKRAMAIKTNDPQAQNQLWRTLPNAQLRSDLTVDSSNTMVLLPPVYKVTTPHY